METDDYSIHVLPEEYGIPQFVCGRGFHFESLLDAVLIGVLGQCGCGCPENQAHLIHFSLSLLTHPASRSRTQSGIDKWGGKNGWLFFLHWANEKRLTDHGAGIGASWLNDKGKFVLQAISWAVEV